MTKRTFPAFLAMSAVAFAAASWGCVSDRPSRNGVFNENQYLRKSFLIREGDGSTKDDGWMLRASFTQVSTPNPLGGVFIVPGAENGGQLVRFKVSQDKLQMVSNREISTLDPKAADIRTEEIINAWPVTNVDLKYRVNYDGETTNFYEENQELDWPTRQWVKLNLSKNDSSDVAPFGAYAQYYLDKCVDQGNMSVTLVPGSFQVDEPGDYIEWTVQMSLPLKFDDQTCIDLYGYDGVSAQKLGRNSVTANMKYSLMRAKADSAITYQPLEIQEKDPIRHKYGFFETTTLARDPDSGLLAARQLVNRWDPNRDKITWYFTQDWPEQYKVVFNGPGGIADQTNAILQKAGAKARVEFKNYDDGGTKRYFGDARYSFLQWLADKDTGAGFAGVTQFFTDPRTGEIMQGSITISEFEIKDYYVQFIEAYLKQIGACPQYNYGNSEGKFCVFDTNSTDPMGGTWPDPYDPTKLLKDANGNLTGQIRDAKDNIVQEAPKLACTADLAKAGGRVPIVPDEVVSNHNGTSTLYAKMQQYLGKLPSIYGALGPQDFIYKQDDDFFKAYFAISPYHVYGDPDANQFVIREGGAGVYGPAAMWERSAKEAEFHKIAGQIDRGVSPFDITGMGDGFNSATTFLNKFRDLTQNHKDLQFAKAAQRNNQMMDSPDSFSFLEVVARDARKCVDNSDGKGPHWETKEEWLGGLIKTYWDQTIWHEFGHSMGLRHNFMSSIDQPNFPDKLPPDPNAPDEVRYPLYASSVMEYNTVPDRIFWKQGWGPYDQGAIAFAYANASSASRKDPDVNTLPGKMKPKFESITGQITPTAPWADPMGFKMDANGNYLKDSAGFEQERRFLFCTDENLKYSPFCRQGDLGITPSQIIANEIDSYESHYAWRNFRKYRKFWDDSKYANGPAGEITNLRRFISSWVYDWSAAEISDTFRKIGIEDTSANPISAIYYQQLSNKFAAEMSAANQLVAAFHKAIIQQGSGERPFRTIYDPYYGDVTQQGIILDKLYAMQGFVGMWPTDNYDQNQAGGYIVSYGFGDNSYFSLAQDVVNSMVGGQYDVYPYFVPLAVAQFAQDTHSPSYPGPSSVRDWIGGYKFDTVTYFLDFFRDMAVTNGVCKTMETCKFDPRVIDDDHNEFIGPDKRVWVWLYIQDRNQYIAVQKDRHTATYILARNYANCVVFGQDDGHSCAYSSQLSLKYTLDYFTNVNQSYLVRWISRIGP